MPDTSSPELSAVIVDRDASTALAQHVAGVPYRITGKGNHVPQAVGRVIASLAVDSNGAPLPEHFAVTEMRVDARLCAIASKRGLSFIESADMDAREQAAGIALRDEYKAATTPERKARAARDFLKLASLRARRTT